ncbi:hypothetical protein KKA53_03600 [Candidatus Dependentiae bacterium]|nr:hypothetical protein [Candidatus Dependentiae bacterium]
MFKKIIDSLQTNMFQQIIIFFSILYIATMLVIQYEQSYFAEKNYEVTKVTDIEKRLASDVEVGLFINNFPKFSFHTNSFIMDAAVWFKFPIGNESLSTINKFSFKNGEILSKSNPVVQMQGSSVVISYQVVVKFITPLNHKHFPVSDHKLTIILQNKSVSPAELYFSSDVYNFDLSDNLLTGNWQPSKQYVDNGYIQSSFKKEDQKKSIRTDFPCVVFTIDFKNQDARHFILLYLPLLLIFFIVFTSLLTKIDAIDIRFPVVASVVPILALHSLVIESASPVGSDITKIDQIYLALILLALLILLFQSYLSLALKGATEDMLTKKKKLLKQMNDFVIIFVLTALLCFVTYSTFT